MVRTVHTTSESGAEFFRENFNEYPSCFDYRRTDGIGRATALAFAKEGAQVVVSGRSDEEGQKLVTEIRKAARKRSLSAPMYAEKKTYGT